MEKKYNCVYRTRNKHNNKIYIGVHCTDDLYDGYIGCGVKTQGNASSKNKNSPLIRAIRKYGYDSFETEIIIIYSTKQEAYKAEELIVTKEFINRRDTYNAQVGGKINRQSKGTLKRSNHAFSKRVKCKSTGVVYDSIATVAELIGLKHSTLLNKLNGRCYNDTDFELVDKSNVCNRLKTRNNIKYTRLRKYSLNGVFIEEYEDITNVDPVTRSNLITVFSDNAKSTRKIVSGYLWEAYDPYLDKWFGKEWRDYFQYYAVDEYMNVTPFIKFSLMLEFIGYSKNSGWRVKTKLNTDKLVKGYKIYTKKVYEEKYGKIYN